LTSVIIYGKLVQIISSLDNKTGKNTSFFIYTRNEDIYLDNLVKSNILKYSIYADSKPQDKEEEE